MKVFISWSGDRTKKVAEAFNEWLGQLIQATEPWMSPNIEKGKRWNDEIKKALGESKIGIICLDKDNLNSKWILFEAGAIAKTDDAHPCTFLLDIKPSDVEPPLGDFQHTIFEKDDIRRLAHTINEKVRSSGEKTLDAARLNSLFDNLYPNLEIKLKEILKIQPTNKHVQRDDRDILEEILQTVRAIQQDGKEENIIFDKNSWTQIYAEYKKKYGSPLLKKNPFELSYNEFVEALKENRIRSTIDGLVVDDKQSAKSEVEISNINELNEFRRKYRQGQGDKKEGPKE